MSRSDPRPDHTKLGYAWVMEMRAIRDRLRAADPARYEVRLGGFLLEQDASAAYAAAHANDPTYRETSARIAANAKCGPAPFTTEELARIAEHFAGANDPVAAAIYAKAIARL